MDEYTQLADAINPQLKAIEDSIDNLVGRDSRLLDKLERIASALESLADKHGTF